MPRPARRQRRLLASILLVALCAPAHLAVAADPPRRLLLVGNSINYTNNLPALLHALLAGQGRGSGVAVDMFVRPGATLEDLDRDPRLEGVLARGHYDAVVLQEQGGHTLCAAEASQRDTDSCRHMIEAHRHLALRARAAAAGVYYLGTYQPVSASAALAASERWLAGQMQASYIGVEPEFLALSSRYPALPWFHPGDRHPGIALSALMAERIYLTLYGAPLVPAPLCTRARLYPPQEQLDGLVGFSELVAPRGPAKCVLTASEAELLARPDARP